MDFNFQRDPLPPTPIMVEDDHEEMDQATLPQQTLPTRTTTIQSMVSYIGYFY